MDWYRQSTDQVLELTESRLEGLADSESRERLARHGANALQVVSRKPVWLMLLSQFRDVMILILVAAALISVIAGEWRDSIVILIIVALNAIVGFLQEFRAERAMEALKRMSAPKATVLRDGLVKQIEATALVPGDVVLLETGNVIPADLRLLESQFLEINESSLTGEVAGCAERYRGFDRRSIALGGPDEPGLQRNNRIVWTWKGTGCCHRHADANRTYCQDAAGE